MARPKKSDTPDLSEAQDLTAGLIERLTCPADKTQVFLRDIKAPGLRVRATAASAKNPKGLKAFVYEAKLNKQTIRRTIGDVRVWDIEAARNEARRLAVVIRSNGDDPRELERQQEAEKAAAIAKKAAEDAANALRQAAQALTVGEAWQEYIEQRRPHWGERHYRDHIEKASPGGVQSKRGNVLTEPGPLAALMPLALKDLDKQTIERWASNEGKTRPTSARLAWRLLKAFLSWCNEQPAYAEILSGNPAKNKKSREALGKPAVKTDVLQKGQLSAWFTAVQQIHNPTVSAALQMMLLTGARPGEVLSLRWDDVNTKWKGIQIRDKVEGTREIPATPYMLHLLTALPRRNEYVFAGLRAETIANPTELHTRACKMVGLEGLTLHGLRRSFKSLTEWLEIPAGVVAQLMGHKPSATAEKHYTVRPLDLLRVHHEKIEAWILEQAGIVFDAKAAPAALRVVAG